MCIGLVTSQLLSRIHWNPALPCVQERIPVFRPTYVSQEHFKAVFDRAVRAVAQEVALLPSRAAGNMIGDV